MKYAMIFSFLINLAMAQTGPKASSNDKRVNICCGKATTIISAPNAESSKGKTKPTKSSTGKNQ